VIVTDQCGIAPLLDGIAGIAGTHSISSICEKMSTLLNDPNLYAQLKNGLRHCGATIRLGLAHPAKWILCQKVGGHRHVLAESGTLESTLSVGSHRVFRIFWWETQCTPLALSLLGTLYTGIWEHSVRQYLKGFSDAVHPRRLLRLSKRSKPFLPG